MSNPVQFANPDEIPQIVALCGKSMIENGFSDLGIKADPEKAITEIAEAVAGGVVLVKRNKDNPRILDGVFGLSFSSTWFSTDQYLAGLIFYVNEDKRSYRLAREFLETAKEYAIINNVPIVFDVFSQKDADTKKALFKRSGFKDYGSTLVFIP